MATKTFDLVIIGGGIIGLATAMEAARRFPNWRIVVIEKENRVAAHQTGHNSGVIHSGIYYKPGSLKARTCVEGGAAMVAFCREHGIPYQICGKVVVATQEEELPALEELYRRGSANGVPSLAMIGPEPLREIEPHSAGIRALRVPGAGITDYTAVAGKYAEIVAAGGGEVRTRTEATGIIRRSGETIVETTQGALAARTVINCAGLHSDRIARLAGAQTDLRIVPFRGEYYEIAPERASLVKALIYPVPDPSFPFLGVHFTRRIHGGIEAGPNAVLAFRREGYRKTDFSISDTLATFAFPGFWRMARKYWRSGLEEYYRSLSKRAFVRALQRLVPEIQEADLRPGGAGVRAQALDRTGKLLDDFHIVRTDNVIHVLNVPSPAATASIVIGRRIVDLLEETTGLNA
ncbi:MAG: hydroxyglutarate oxidase [Acidobacteria bacterium RIFCSPLOWO2_12_FULL_60_22]|nr:MAG: hydroxyglutarate oxidase [Acidobacteria bacterium RIFCSPLOWO2_12_FULL_60_22]